MRAENSKAPGQQNSRGESNAAHFSMNTVSRKPHLDRRVRRILAEDRSAEPALSFFETIGSKTDAENPQVNR
jgi:hypothetical protein